MAGRKRPRTDPEVVESRYDTHHDGQHEQHDEQEGGISEKPSTERGPIGKAHNSRSNHSIVEGGVDEFRGEPPEGYGTVAPGKQNAGKR